MGIGKTTQTSTSTIPGMSAAASRMQELLLQAGEQAAGQLGGEISMDPTTEQLESIQMIQERTGDVARSQMMAGLEESQRAVEGGLLERGVAGGTVEAVSQAINARDAQRRLDEFVSGQAAQGAEMAINTGFAQGQMQLTRNQQLLQQLLGAGEQIGGMDIQERRAQGTTVATQDVGAFGALAQLGAQAGSMFMPGMGGAGGAAAGAAPTGQSLYEAGHGVSPGDINYRLGHGG